MEPSCVCAILNTRLTSDSEIRCESPDLSDSTKKSIRAGGAKCATLTDILALGMWLSNTKRVGVLSMISYKGFILILFLIWASVVKSQNQESPSLIFSIKTTLALRATFESLPLSDGEANFCLPVFFFHPWSVEVQRGIVCISLKVNRSQLLFFVTLWSVRKCKRGLNYICKETLPTIHKCGNAPRTKKSTN